MSQADFSTAEAGRAVFVRKQSANIYTMLLIIAFLAVAIGCIFLVLEMKAYELSPKVSPEAKVPPPQVIGMRIETSPIAPALRILS